MKLKEITIENFKGINFLNLVVGEKGLLLEGENRTHKTTVLSSILWVLTDKDYDLTNNHDLFPDDGRECQPSVKLTFDDVMFKKYQKKATKESKIDGVNDQVKVDNKYEVNDVPMPLKDFNKKLEELGINVDMIVPCMHTEYFMSQVQKDMRKVVLNMAKTYTDSQIAAKKPITRELVEQLEKYKMEELKAMATAQKKLAEEKIIAIPRIIDGIEQSKTTFDINDLKNQRSVFKKQLEDIEKRLVKKDNGSAELQREKIGKEYELEAYVRDMSQSVLNEHTDAERMLNDKMYALEKNNAYLNDYETKKVELEGEIKQSIQFRQENVKSRYFEEKEKTFDDSNYVFDESKFIFDESKWVFDESSTKCRLCGQDLPEEKVAELKETFEQKKQYEKDRIEKLKQSEKERIETNKKNDEKRFLINQSNAMNKILQEGRVAEEKEKQLAEKVTELELKIKSIKEQINQNEIDVADAKIKFDNCKKEVDFSNDEKYNSIKSEIEMLQSKIDTLLESKEDTSILDDSKAKIIDSIRQIEDQIAVSKRNDELNENIEKHKADLADANQKKADAEKTLYLLDKVSKTKNELIVDEINSKFEIVKWKLFDYQKNGEYKEVCEPQIMEGSTLKGFKDQMSTGMRIQAKLDICFSLQKFYNMELPVLLDEATSLSEKYFPDLQGKQLVMAKVTKDETLKISQL